MHYIYKCTFHSFTQHTMTDESIGNGRQTTVMSSEEENYLRIAHLLVRVAPSAVRVKFNYEFHPVKLKTYLHKHRYTSLEDLKRKKVINQNQWDLLFPNSGEQIKLYLLFVVIFIIYKQ